MGKALELFWNRLRVDPLRVQYGFKYVKKCLEMNAVDTLLVCDSLFRNFATRRDYVNLCEETKKDGGKVLQFSTLHVTGQQLMQLTGVACLLHYPLDLENDVEFLSSTSVSNEVGPEFDVDERSIDDSEYYTTDSDDDGREDCESDTSEDDEILKQRLNDGLIEVRKKVSLSFLVHIGPIGHIYLLFIYRIKL